jgi:fibronectin type 3 domain-containing protein
VRLIWDPVAAPDLAGYLLFRAEGAGAPAPIRTSPISDTFYSDESVETGRRYRYTVVAIDSAGNRSAASSEAIGEPF